MKYLILLINIVLLASSVACQQEVSSDKVKQAAIQTQTEQKENSFIVPQHYKGTIPSIAFPIATDYPYDIDLQTIDGNVVKSSSIFKQNGKPTVILFWLTTCYPCGLELNALKEKYPQWIEEADFNFYAISTDFPKNYENFVKRVKNGGWTFEAYHDKDRVFRNIIPGNLNGLPQVFIYDKEGNIVYHKRKYKPGDEDTLFEKIKSFL